MADVLITYLRANLPGEVAVLADTYLKKLEAGSYEELLQCPEARILLGHDTDPRLQTIQIENFDSWNDFLFQRLGAFLAHRSQAETQIAVFCIGYAALLAFVQSNITGPPLRFSPSTLLFPASISESQDSCHLARQTLVAGLSVDGIAAYKLTPNIELLCLADAVMTCPPILKSIKAARWAKLRVSFMHQRLLSEVSTTVQNSIYDDLGLLEADLDTLHMANEHYKAGFLLERSTIHIHHGLDKSARADLEEARSELGFEFALTGLLGKRTKFQQFDTSQLVVLAKSASDTHTVQPGSDVKSRDDAIPTNPTKLDLNDDTLLESISFSKKPAEQSSTDVVAMDSIPPSLKALDPSKQPLLQPLDSIVLLLLASSITNTSAQDGLTREETIPYATRVLEGGSSNWQVYTQALLVRSRIEGYRSRTVERGLLQLQALVDQVIAETTAEGSLGKDAAVSEVATSTFLPKANGSESAPVTERLRYVFQLASPTRWELEAELAARWVQLGGLRSALEIYERLEMWAEAALCWAATEHEDKAQRLVRKQLFHATNGGPDISETNPSEDEEWKGPARQPPPADAPRLYCILGDIGPSIEMYETAWEVSNKRYARAQRSIGRYFIAAKDFAKAAEAYSKSLAVNQLNQSSWFALGCALLELEQFPKAVEAFSRVVQLDDTDAEAWSNLAAALLKTDPEDAPPTKSTQGQVVKLDDDEEFVSEPVQTPAERHLALRRDALQALKRAAGLKHESHRIWENVLIVAASLSPPDYNSVLAAQRRIIDLRGKTAGEKCIDVEILQMLVSHIIIMNDTYDPNQVGIARMIVKFIDDTVVPLITGSAALWQLVGKLALWRNKPSTALDAEEKAWRAITSLPGWETDSEKRWNEVVEATVRLSDSYESLGPKERTEGMGAGELVMKDWKFKARSAVRGIMGRGKDSWEGTEGWDRLKDVMEGLRA